MTEAFSALLCGRSLATLATASWLLGLWSSGVSAGCYTLVDEPRKNHFVLVLDRSGSMQGAPLQRAVAGVAAFASQMQEGDVSSLLAFGSSVEKVQPATGDGRAVATAAQKIRASGSTVLYDALAQAVAELRGISGMRVIVYMTDGTDTGSRFSMRDVERMCAAEGVFVYGIGMGKVDRRALDRLSEATGGLVTYAAASSDLEGLYRHVMSTYYETYGSGDWGSYTVRSLPDSRPVYIDGQSMGSTPLKVDRVAVGKHTLEVRFERGTWSCSGPAASGKRTLVDARESDLGYDLRVASRPHGAMVFLDSAFVGQTSASPLVGAGDRWAEAILVDRTQLFIAMIPPGRHQLRLVALPEFDFGAEQEVEFDISLSGDAVLLADVLRGRASWGAGEELVGRRPRLKRGDPESDLEADLEEFRRR